jgi:hypothetical protein
MLFNTTFSYIVAVSFIGDKKPEYPAKTTTLSQVSDKLYGIMLYRVYPPCAGLELTTNTSTNNVLGYFYLLFLCKNV